MKGFFSVVICLTVVGVPVLSVPSKVDRVEIISRESYANGRAFGKTGPYEKLIGTVFYSIDPDLPANAEIVDLDKAERGSDGFPKCDKDGNPLGGIRLPDIDVPLATSTGWNLRDRGVGAENEPVSMDGSHIPFPKTKEERFCLGDPRLSIEERYGNFNGYLEEYTSAARGLVAKGYLLQEDAERMIRRRERFRHLFSRE